MASQFNRFKETLSELFMLDQAELDFGIYRIMNQKRTEIDRYLDIDLVRQVKEVLAANAGGKRESLLKEIAEATKNAESLGVDAATLPKIQTLKAELSQLGGAEELENDVYDHLATFFKRYYDGGDFISLRRYKKDVYAIPYEGEEVKLHWANADQYYIKTSEYFRNYTFKLEGDKRVSFVLLEASTEQNNNKSQGDKERRFAIYAQMPVEADGAELRINFTYEPTDKKEKQADLMAAAYAVVKPLVPVEFSEVFSLRATDKNKNRTLLEKHFTDYVAKNTFDYFIHKDLRGFLTRELDFYIKNEILFIDDIDTKQESEFVKYLSAIKAVKAVGAKIIDFLSSLEDFQKKLWLKKKFVAECNYCITLDRVPEELYAEIACNDVQREEWVRLFAIDEIKSIGASGLFFDGATVGYSVPLSIEFLKSNPHLVLDTAFFDDRFRQHLVSSIHNFDEQLDGTLINSENFQALNLLQEKHNEQINGIYVDPPYNTSASEIVYKNSYKESSWLTLISDRFILGKKFLKDDGIQCSTIDDVENSKFQVLIEDIFGKNNMVGIVPIKINPSGRPTERGFALTHEYAIFSAKTDSAGISKVPRTSEQMSRYDQKDKRGVFEYRNLRREGSNSDRENGQRQYYPIYGNLSTQQIRVPKMEWIEDKREWTVLESEYDNEVVIFPVNDAGREKNWRWSEESVKSDYTQFLVRIPQGGTTPQVYYKYRPNEEGITPFTMWTEAKFSATEHGTKVIKDLFNESNFAYPKSIYAVEESLSVIGVKKEKTALVLDFFAGSGTTGHAVINLNREDEGRRKYILVEMGTYFDTVTKPRIQKVIYSRDWKDGKPVSRAGSSHCFKYLRLEQYEDTLNNLVVKQTNEQKSAFDTSDTFRESFLLGYMLDAQTQDSLLSADWFINPFAVSLNITRQNEMQQRNIDIIETFNYLIGLNIDSIAYPKEGICTVTGTTRRGEHSLIIWRDCTKIDNEALNKFFTKSAYSTRDNEFDRIYINGDNNLENLRTDEDHWKVVLTEEEFAKRMFEKK